jgi:hypothetical protein
MPPFGLSRISLTDSIIIDLEQRLGILEKIVKKVIESDQEDLNKFEEDTLKELQQKYPRYFQQT